MQTSLRSLCVMHLLLFVCLSLLTVPPCVGRAVGPVASVNELVSALRDSSVDLINLGSGVFSLDAASGGLTIGPNRQVELVGSINVEQVAILGGLNLSHSQVAFQYASGIDFGSNSQGLFRLGDNTSLGFRNLFLWHGLSQLGYDWQVVTLAQPGARASVRFYQTVKLREGCLPLQIFVQHVNSYTRLQDAGGQQAASVLPFCFAPPAGGPPATTGSAGTTVALNGSHSGNASWAGSNATCLSETLAIGNLATNITRSNGQSYNLYEQSSTYWCLAYASMSCLSASGPEQCVKELLEANNGSPAPASSPAPAASNRTTDTATSDGNKITNILVPAVITGVLVLGFVFATLWCIRRRGATKRGSSLPGGGGGGEGGDGGDLERGGAEAGGGWGVGDALARLLPGAAARDAHRKKPYIPGYVPVVSKEALDRIAKVRAELSSKMVVASSTDDLSDVRNLHLVGKGTFGRVYKGEWKGVTVALKVISVPVSQYGQAQWQQVLGEAAISTLLNHPCVLQTYSVALLEYSPATKPISTASEEGTGGNNGGSSGKGGANSGEQQQPPAAVNALLDTMAPFYQLKMVSEFCEGGSVVQALRRMQFYDSVGGGTVRLPAVIDIASQVASGMAYLHSANIIHADLKAANVLLKQQPGSGKLQAKVGDFGLSFRMDEPEATHVTKGQLGSITHMAPEVLVHGRVSKASDVYSFGILLYELYTGQQAYWDVPQPMLAYHVATAGGRPPLPSHCPAAYRGLAKACWSSEPASRPTFDDIYKRLQGLAQDVNRCINNNGQPTNDDDQHDRGSVDAASVDTAAYRDGGRVQQQPVGGEPTAAAQASAGQLLSAAATAACGTADGGQVAPPPSQEVPLAATTAATAAGAASTTTGVAAPGHVLLAEDGDRGGGNVSAAALRPCRQPPPVPAVPAVAVPAPLGGGGVPVTANDGDAAAATVAAAPLASNVGYQEQQQQQHERQDGTPGETHSATLVSDPGLGLILLQQAAAAAAAPAAVAAIASPTS